MRGVAWYRKAAGQGEALAQFGLSTIHEFGQGGLPKDDVQSVAWYRKAADQGRATAQFNLAVMYAEGRGGLVKN